MAKRCKAGRGVSTVVGTAFFVLILALAFSSLLLVYDSIGKLTQAAQQAVSFNYAKSREDLEVTCTIGPNSTFTVKNYGPSVVHITYVVVDHTWEPVDVYVAPGEEASFSLAVNIAGNKTRIVTSYGNSFSAREIVFKKPIVVVNNENHYLTDVAVQVNLTTSNFDYSKARSDGGDLRFYWEGMELDYYIERWNTSGTSTVWVRVPVLPPSGVAVIYMYYGNKTLTSKSNFDKLFTIGECGWVEAGGVDGGDGGWVWVNFTVNFTSTPVVVASPMTFNEGGPASSDAAVVRIRGLNSTGFYVRMEEYLSGFTHVSENISWIALKPGVWNVGSLKIEAGLSSAVGEASGYSTTSFSSSFSSSSAILFQVNSYREVDLGSHTRQDNPTSQSSDVKVEEYAEGSSHVEEVVGYVVCDGGVSYSFMGVPQMIQAGRTPDAVRDSWYTYTFPVSFPNTPIVITKIMTEDGGHNCEERMRNVTPNSFDVRVEETPYYDGPHTSEVFGWLALNFTGPIYGTGYYLREPTVIVQGEIPAFSYGG